MSTETEPTASAPAAPNDQGATPNEEPLGAPGLSALKSEREARAAAEERAAAAEARAKDYEDRDKTELQKLQDALDTTRRERDEARLAKARADVAAAKNVPAELLKGSTAEEFEAAADALVAWRGEQTTEPTPDPAATRVVIPGEGGQPSLPLNDDGLESALKQALGIN